MPVLVTSCCYFCHLRAGCISSALWLILYYSIATGQMFYEISTCSTEVTGYWNLGISFAIMIGVSFILFCASLCKSIVLIVLFLVLQIPAIGVELTYMFVALIYGIALNTFILYGMPLILLGYIDLVAYSYMEELRQARRERASQNDDEEEY